MRERNKRWGENMTKLTNYKIIFFKRLYIIKCYATVFLFQMIWQWKAKLIYLSIFLSFWPNCIVLEVTFEFKWLKLSILLLACAQNSPSQKISRSLFVPIWFLALFFFLLSCFSCENCMWCVWKLYDRIKEKTYSTNTASLPGDPVINIQISLSLFLTLSLTFFYIFLYSVSQKLHYTISPHTETPLSC